MRIAAVFLLGVVIFFAGCAQQETEPAVKNDIVTIENFFVSDVTPYEKGKVSMQFVIKNNGDETLPWLEVEFFDTPGFDISSLKCEPLGTPSGDKRKCVFGEENELEPFDSRDITIEMTSNKDVSSPTPHTTSIAIRYVYFGSRDVAVPVIDGETRKQPLTKLKQSEPSPGPISLDINPSIEREVVVDDKIVRDNWAVGGDSPLPFLTKFKFAHLGTLAKVKDVNITLASLRLKVNGLDQEGVCDFCDITQDACKNEFNKIKTGSDADKESFGTDELGKILSPSESRKSSNIFYGISPAHLTFNLKEAPDGYIIYSTKSVLVPFGTLVCTFRPESKPLPEYSASISTFFAYKYEFIKKHNCVNQTKPE